MIGAPRAHYRILDSTNERAKQLALAGAPHGTLVTADEQTAGRGRQGRSWVAPPRSAVLMSLVVRDPPEVLPLAAAVAVCEACDAVASVSCSIKWPNDVRIDGRKLAGILVEGRPQKGWAVLGIGINVSAAPHDLPATCLDVPHVEDVLRPLLAELATWLERPATEVLAAWRERDELRGERVRWLDGEGLAAGIDDTGALLVETDRGRVALDAGEVHLAPRTGGRSG
jgi:BirA family biotin operon repressor/biotin-[acetyl-CoA-carboxylase] ligase